MSGEAPVYIAGQGVGPAPRVTTTTVAIPHFPNKIAPAVAQFGEAATEAIDKKLQAANLTAALKARTQFMTGMAGFVQQYRGDPDPTTAAYRFAKDVEQLKTDQLGTIANPTMRQSAEMHMEVQALQQQRQMENFSLKRQLDMNVDGLKTRRSLYLQGAATSGSATEREAVTSSFDDEVDGLGKVGFFSAPQVAAAKTRFRADVASGDAKAAIAANPDHAAVALGDPDSFPGLDPFTRIALQRQANDAADGAAWHAQQTADAAATKAFAAGTLDKASLDGAAPQLSAAVYRSLSGALNPTAPNGANFDPHLYADHLSRAADLEPGMTVEAADAYAGGRLDHDGFKRVLDTAQRSAGDFDAGMEWRVEQRRDLYKMLSPADGQSAAAARAQVEAGAGFDQWLDAHPDATQDQSQAQMEAVVKQARAAAAASDRATLPIPAGITKARGDIGGDAIAEAATRLRDAFGTFQIDDNTATKEADLLRAWQTVATNAGGEQ